MIPSSGVLLQRQPRPFFVFCFLSCWCLFFLMVIKVNHHASTQTTGSLDFSKSETPIALPKTYGFCRQLGHPLDPRLTQHYE